MRGRLAAPSGIAFLVLLLAALFDHGGTATAGGRTVAVTTQVSIERVADDLGFPFDKPEPGDQVLVRVSATSKGPATVKRNELVVSAQVFSERRPSVRGRQSLRCEVRRGAGWVVNCRNSRVVREGETLSVLIGVVAAGSRVTVIAGSTKAPGVETDLVVKSTRDRVAIEVQPAEQSARPEPWAGVWTWKATWPDGSFTGPTGMTIAQEGTTACARWSWTSGGTAKGTVAGDLTWSADWNDGFGSGTWILILEPGGNRFTGTQVVNPHSTAVQGFTATIAGERTGGPNDISLDCDTVSVGRDALSARR